MKLKTLFMQTLEWMTFTGKEVHLNNSTNTLTQVKDLNTSSTTEHATISWYLQKVITHEISINLNL